MEDAATAFAEKKKALDEARVALVAEVDALKTEKKETVARINAKLKELRALLGRTRSRKGAKSTTPRAKKPPKPAADQPTETA